jgi:hypothetical protein
MALGLISDRHAKGIRRSECDEALRRLDTRLARHARRAPPRRRKPWVKFWTSEFFRTSGELAVKTYSALGRNPIVIQLTLEPLTAPGEPQGFQLFLLVAEYRNRTPKVLFTPVRISGHALDRLVGRGNLVSMDQWMDELRPALAAAYQLAPDKECIDRLMAIGDGSRFHIPTRSGYARMIREGKEFVIVTWLHRLDLNDAQRMEAAMQAAEISRAVPLPQPKTMGTSR